MTEERQTGQKYHQLLQGILLDPEITLKSSFPVTAGAFTA
jgi:hypothetical protein